MISTPRCVLALLGLVPIALCAAHAQEPATQPSVDARDGQERGGKEAQKRRILHLASGQAIRVVSRWTETGWEFRAKSGWKTLPPSMVVGAELESDVLAAWRAKQKELDAKKTDERVQLARWAATAGLAQEALVMLDGVLERSPDHADALAILRERWLLDVPRIDVAADALPAAIAELLRTGATLPLAGREVAVNELSKLADRDALRAELARELRASAPLRRSFAALVLRRLFVGEELKPLLRHSIFDPAESVRRECALALRATDEPGVVAPLERALQSSNGPVRLRAAEALGHAGFKAAVPALVARLAAAQGESGRAHAPRATIFIGRQYAYIQDFDVEVAQFQAVADPSINVLVEGQATEVGVLGTVEVAFADESAAIRRSLERLTGVRPGSDARAWLRWWDEHGASFGEEPKTKAG